MQCIQPTAGVHRTRYILTLSEYALFKLSSDDAYTEPKHDIFMPETQILSILRRGLEALETAGMARKIHTYSEQCFCFPESLSVLGWLQIPAA